MSGYFVGENQQKGQTEKKKERKRGPDIKEGGQLTTRQNKKKGLVLHLTGDVAWGGGDVGVERCGQSDF